MGLSSFAFITILLFTLSVQNIQGQFWDPPGGLCWGRYEQYRPCASTCPDTCDDIRWRNPMKICNLMCRSGCECMRPFVRLDRNPMSPCVHPVQCRFK